MDYIVFHRILTPVQGAWFILEAYPLKCDCLALAAAALQLHSQPDPYSAPAATGGLYSSYQPSPLGQVWLTLLLIPS